jgi:hypothetical protein
MAIICDVCSTDVTPDKDLILDSDIPDYHVVNINGKICLCHDCYCALAEFMRSDAFKKVVADYKEQFEKELD